METAAPPPERVLCPHCGNRSRTSDYCSNCSRAITPPATSNYNKTPAELTLPGAELANMLSMLGGMVLIAGIIGAIWIYSKIGTVTTGGGFFGGPQQEATNPYGVALSFATGMSGVIWCALLNGVSRAIRNTIDLSTQIARLHTR